MENTGALKNRFCTKCCHKNPETLFGWYWEQKTVSIIRIKVGRIKGGLNQEKHTYQRFAKQPITRSTSRRLRRK